MDPGIIEPVGGPAPWVNPVVIVPNYNGKFTPCIDTRQANQTIIRRRYPIPTVDEMLRTGNGSKVFSKLDLKCGYHQFPLPSYFGKSAPTKIITDASLVGLGALPVQE